ncbi:MAG: hypothetical protein ACRDP6_35895, partial [Actinoallomurus sp.]
YGQCGFNALVTEILAYREPFVLLKHHARIEDPYSIVDAVTRETRVRYADPVQARHALDEFADHVYRFRPPEET